MSSSTLINSFFILSASLSFSYWICSFHSNSKNDSDEYIPTLLFEYSTNPIASENTSALGSLSQT